MRIVQKSIILKIKYQLNSPSNLPFTSLQSSPKISSRNSSLSVLFSDCGVVLKMSWKTTLKQNSKPNGRVIVSMGFTLSRILQDGSVDSIIYHKNYLQFNLVWTIHHKNNLQFNLVWTIHHKNNLQFNLVWITGSDAKQQHIPPPPRPHWTTQLQSKQRSLVVL